MRAICLHHSALCRALGILDQKTALSPFHEADDQDQHDDHGKEADDQSGADAARTSAFKQV